MGAAHPVVDDGGSRPLADAARVAFARTSSGEHTIKLIDACIREYQIAPRPEYLAAALAWST
jgi:hypothetical protein